MIDLEPTEIKEFLRSLGPSGQRCHIVLKGGVELDGLVTFDAESEYPADFWPSDSKSDPTKVLLCWTEGGGYFYDPETWDSEDPRDIISITKSPAAEAVSDVVPPSTGSLFVVLQNSDEDHWAITEVHTIISESVLLVKSYLNDVVPDVLSFVHVKNPVLYLCYADALKAATAR